jgi:hypothetical protein
MNNPSFSDKEIAAIRHMIADLATQCREDIAGTILYTGAFHHLENGDAAVVELARKLKLPMGEDQKELGKTKVETKSEDLVCDDCHEQKPDVCERECPYASDVNNKLLMITVCNSCAHERAMDI